jgi:hypothetical protein
MFSTAMRKWWSFLKGLGSWSGREFASKADVLRFS